MKILRVIFGGIIAICAFCTLFFGINTQTEAKNDKSDDVYKGIITLWHVETFEGGTGSRKQFLLKAARGFERNNTGTLISVVSHTSESFNEQISSGNYPDLVSYGVGVNVKNQSVIDADKTFYAGVLGNKSYALPWCGGGYVLIRNPRITDKNNIVLSCGENNLPECALLLREEKFSEIKREKQRDAYQSFCTGKFAFLLGTQRDIVRLTNSGMEFSVEGVPEFNDLYQYISVTSLNDDKLCACNEFVKYLLSEEVQKQLSVVNMQSIYYDVEGNPEEYRKLHVATAKSTVSAFSSKDDLAIIKSIASADYVDKEAQTKKLKNVLLMP